MSGQRKLLLDCMGVGKTAQSVVAFNSLGSKRTLILCPSSVRDGWVREIKRWSTRELKIQVINGMKDWLDEEAQVVIVSYNLLSSPMNYDQLKAQRWPVMILDEVHYLKNAKAKRTKLVFGRHGLISKAVYVWGLSGTLMPNRPIDLFTPFHAMAKDLLGKYDDWMKFTGRYCKRYKSPMGHWDVSGSTRISELRERLFDTGFAIRRTKEDVLHELPAKQVRINWLDFESSRKMHSSAAWQAVSEGMDTKKTNLGLGGAELAEVRKIVGLAKVKRVIEIAKDIIAVDGYVVVFCWHREVLEQIHEGLGGVTYHGGMNATRKSMALHEFQVGTAQAFVANYASAGTGLDGLQHRASSCVFAELPWTYAELAQTTDRLHRMGQKNSVLVDLVVADESTDTYVLDTIMSKEKDFKDLMLTRC